MSDDIRTLVTQARSPTDLAARHKAFETLVHRFQNMAVGCSLGVLGDFQLAEDVAQDAFLTAYNNLEKLKDPSAFPGWFKQMVLHKSYRMQRLQIRAPLESMEVRNMDLAANTPNQDEQIEKEETRRLVHRALESLPEHERLVTALFYLTGYSQQKIAAFLELPDATVRKRLQRARNRLKERMMQMVEEAFTHHRPSHNDQFTEQTVDMIRAAETGDLSKIAALLSRNPSLAEVNAPLSDQYPIQAKGWKPLHIAAWHSRAQTVEFLLEQGADINARCGGNRTPLHYAVEAGNDQTRQLLIDKGAHIDIALAAILGMVDRVKEMLDEDPTLANDKSTGGPALEWAAWGGNLEIAKLLVTHGADIAEPAAGYAAVASGNLDLLRFLLDEGMDPNLTWRGQTFLHEAVEMRFTDDNLAIVELLIERGTELNALNQAGKTPLDIALEKGGKGKFTLNPHEMPNEQRQYDKIAALLQERGGRRGPELERPTK